MTDEINRFIHEEILGKCWHERVVDAKGTGGFKVKMRCIKCSDSRYRSHCMDDNPDYCSDESPRRLLNEVVAKVFGPDAAGASFYINAWSNAEQIARACVQAWKSTHTGELA